MDSNRRVIDKSIELNRPRILFGLGWVVAYFLSLLLASTVLTLIAYNALSDFNEHEFTSSLGAIQGLFFSAMLYYTYLKISKPMFREDVSHNLLSAKGFTFGSWLLAIVASYIIFINALSTGDNSKTPFLMVSFMMVTAIPILKGIKLFKKGNHSYASLIIFFTIICTVIWVLFCVSMGIGNERQAEHQQRQIDVAVANVQQKNDIAIARLAKLDRLSAKLEAQQSNTSIQPYNSYSNPNVGADYSSMDESAPAPQISQSNTSAYIDNSHTIPEVTTQTDLPFTGKRFFNFYRGSATGRAITIDEYGNTEVISDNGVEFKGVFTNPLPISNDTAYSFSRDEMVTLLFNNEVATGCDAGILMPDDSYMCVTTIYD